MKQAKISFKTVVLLLFFYWSSNHSSVALITGITGQDGSYLAELLLAKGYTVHGLSRDPKTLPEPRTENNLEDCIQYIQTGQLILHYGDLADPELPEQLIANILPDEVYNLGAQSHVHYSFANPEYTAQVNGLATLRFLEAIKKTAPRKKIKFFQASSSEMFGRVKEIPQSEDTPFNPLSPYAAAKVYAHTVTKIYRQAYGMFACSGILFNHESPRRSKAFITRKITNAVAAIAYGELEVLELGNLNAQRDWGYAPEYVEAMWLMLQQEKPNDFVIATGELHMVREFVDAAFNEIGVTLI
jgi:GDPmannose 4,6-dehydratase